MDARKMRAGNINRNGNKLGDGSVEIQSRQ